MIDPLEMDPSGLGDLQQQEQQFQPPENPDLFAPVQPVSKPWTPPLPEPFTQSESLRLQRLQAGLSQIDADVASGEIHPMHAAEAKQQILPELQRLAQKQQSQQQQQKQQAQHEVMQQNAQALGMQLHDGKTMADTFQDRTASFTDPISGETAHFYQGRHGEWEPIEFPEPAQPEGKGTAEYYPPGLSTPLGEAGPEAQAESPPPTLETNANGEHVLTITNGANQSRITFDKDGKIIKQEGSEQGMAKGSPGHPDYEDRNANLSGGAKQLVPPHVIGEFQRLADRTYKADKPDPRQFQNVPHGQALFQAATAKWNRDKSQAVAHWTNEWLRDQSKDKHETAVTERLQTREEHRIAAEERRRTAEASTERQQKTYHRILDSLEGEKKHLEDKADKAETKTEKDAILGRMPDWMRDREKMETEAHNRAKREHERFWPSTPQTTQAPAQPAPAAQQGPAPAAPSAGQAGTPDDQLRKLAGYVAEAQKAPPPKPAAPGKQPRSPIENVEAAVPFGFLKPPENELKYFPIE